ncbi:MAG: saccharopine dehydrogenase NADP-binding domain-containing protein [bacterium]|nr:saccharopine dehydrogenase NADP-binding domain-containing protein [bacterium]
MNVLILGGGATGSIIAKTLADFETIERVYIGDINDKNAKRFLVSHPKIVFKVLDATKKEDVKDALKDCALLINAASPDFNKDLIKIVLEAGVNYQDLASLWSEAVIEQFEYDEAFKEKGLVALVNASASPGVSNLVIGELCSGLRQIEYIKVRLLEDVSARVPFTAWSKEIAFDEVKSPPYILEDGKFITRDNFGEEEVFDFPEPFINQKCYLMAQEDIGMLPHFIKTKYADVKIGGSEIEFMRTLFQLGLMKTRPIKVGDAMISPYQFMVRVWPDVPSLEEMKKLVEDQKVYDAHFWASVEVSGTEVVKIENLISKETSTSQKKKTLRAHILFPSQSEINKIYPGANYVSYAAGLCAAVFAEKIPNLKRKGVYSPEAIETEDRAKIFSELKKFGIKIETSEIK